MKFPKILFWLLVLSSVLPGCSKKSTEDDQRPIISSINFNVTQVTPGEKISVTSTVTDPQGDPLTYTWTSANGNISEPNDPSTDWVISPIFLPNRNAKISLTVSDGKVTSTLDKEILVNTGVTVSGKIIYAGTSIPISGVAVKLGPFVSTSAPDGTFFFFHISSGTATLEATRAGFDTYTKNVDLSSGNGAYIIPMTSGTETMKVFGTINTIDNILLNGIKVIMLNDDQTESDLTGITDINGNYQISAVPQGIRNFKFKNVSNVNNCQEITKEGTVGGSDLRLDARVKIERQIDMLQDGWDFKTSDLSAPFNGTAYVLSTDGTNSAIIYKYFRPVFCCPIPADADVPQVIMVYRLTGSLKRPNELRLGYPANNQFYMSQDCSTWIDYTNTLYTFWSDPHSTFLPSYFPINSTYKGRSVKLTFGLIRWSGTMPLWEIKSLIVSYFY